MSTRYRRIIAAVLGVIAVGFILTVSYNLYNASEQRHSDYQYQPAGKPGFRIDAGTQAQTPYYRPSCNNPSNRDDADLCAQWAAVEQVAESNRLNSLNLRIAVLAMLLTSVATAFLVWTFYETRETSQRELRAYLCLRPVVIDKIAAGDEPLSISFPIENTGATPANNLVLHWNWQITADKPTSELFEQIVNRFPISQDRDRCIGPHQVKEGKNSINIANEWRERIISGEMTLYIAGQIHYRDSFDRDRVTEFFYHYTETLPNRLGQVNVRNNIR